MSESIAEDKKKKKGIWSKFMAWIARGARQAEKQGQGPCRS